MYLELLSHQRAYQERDCGGTDDRLIPRPALHCVTSFCPKARPDSLLQVLRHGVADAVMQPKPSPNAVRPHQNRDMIRTTSPPSVPPQRAHRERRAASVFSSRLRSSSRRRAALCCGPTNGRAT